MKKITLLGLTLPELKDLVQSLGMPAFTGSQIAKWLYERHVSSIEDMTNLSKANRERLAEVCEIGNSSPIDAQRSKDGTIKYLFPVQTQAKATLTEAESNTNAAERPVRFVETVYIPEEKGHATLCVSCEVGCKYFSSAQYIVQIVHGFTLSHKYDIGEFVNLWQAVNLI